MALGLSLPFGLRDVKLFPVDQATGIRTGEGVDLPSSRTFSFKETVESEELTGDDVVQASHDYNPKVEWELESGGVPFEAYAIMAGGSVTTSGTTPAQVKTFSKRKNESRPYFEVEGQAISDSGGDLHARIYRCKADGDLEGGFEGGSFTLTKAAGKGYGQVEEDGVLYDWIQNETVTPIDTSDSSGG
ncbi:hypothetical protein ACWIG4_30125 [Streptomyces sp. NPDC002248]